MFRLINTIIGLYFLFGTIISFDITNIFQIFLTIIGIWISFRLICYDTWLFRSSSGNLNSSRFSSVSLTTLTLVLIGMIIDYIIGGLLLASAIGLISSVIIGTIPITYLVFVVTFAWASYVFLMFRFDVNFIFFGEKS